MLVQPHLNPLELADAPHLGRYRPFGMTHVLTAKSSNAPATTRSSFCVLPSLSSGVHKRACSTVAEGKWKDLPLWRHQPNESSRK